MTALEGFFPARGRAFIRHVTTAETYAGSPIIVPAQARDKVAKCQFVVVSVGDYEVCEDPDECPRPHYKGRFHMHRLQIGDWVLVKHRMEIITPDPDVFVVNQSDILGVFEERTNPGTSPAPGPDSS